MRFPIIRVVIPSIDSSLSYGNGGGVVPEVPWWDETDESDTETS